MTEFTKEEVGYMSEALRLAKQGCFTTHPNPRVGCVIVSDGDIVGKGWHQSYGGPHAEIHALRDAGKKAKKATAYITLEPCSHHGKTGPCDEALIEAGVSRIVYATEDPFEKNDKSMPDKLNDAGISVSVGLLRDEAKQLNRGFFSRVINKKPFVTLKLGVSIDGATAMESGESQWITGEVARKDVQKLRASSGAILTGSGTIKIDNPSLTVRDETLNAIDPIRVIIDTKLQTAPDAKIYQDDKTTWIFCVDDENKTLFQNKNTEVFKVEKNENYVNLRSVLEILAKKGINDLLVEAGSHLCGALIREELVNEFVIYQAPLIMGSNTRKMFHTPGYNKLNESLRINIKESKKLGEDIKMIAEPIYRAEA